MLLGSKDSENSVYIVDFGIARGYNNPRNGAHVVFSNGKPLVDTVRYASLNTYLGISKLLRVLLNKCIYLFAKAQTRRDDIECLAYSLLDCLRYLRAEARSSMRRGSEKRNELGFPKDSVLASLTHSKHSSSTRTPTTVYKRSF